MPVVCIQRVKFGAAPRGAVGPALASGLALVARPPHAGPPGRAAILLTLLLTTDLDERGQCWNRSVAAWRASGLYGQRRLDLDEPDLATDQKVGVVQPPLEILTASRVNQNLSRRPVTCGDASQGQASRVLAYWEGGVGMATRKTIKGALVGVAGAVVAGVIALQTGAAAEAAQFVQNVIRRLRPRDGSPEEDAEDQGQSGQES